MDQSTGTVLRIGDWCVSPASGQIARNGQSVRVEARMMRLLICLADRAGEAVSIDELLEQVWTGVIVAPDSVYQAVALLRRLLGEDDIAGEVIKALRQSIDGAAQAPAADLRH
jgi:DNA-binding winged helix-turn-helix (wHTH) protein